MMSRLLLSAPDRRHARNRLFPLRSATGTKVLRAGTRWAPIRDHNLSRILSPGADRRVDGADTRHAVLALAAQAGGSAWRGPLTKYLALTLKQETLRSFTTRKLALLVRRHFLRRGGDHEIDRLVMLHQQRGERGRRGLPAALTRRLRPSG